MELIRSRSSSPRCSPLIIPTTQPLKVGYNMGSQSNYKVYMIHLYNLDASTYSENSAYVDFVLKLKYLLSGTKIGVVNEVASVVDRYGRQGCAAKIMIPDSYCLWIGKKGKTNTYCLSKFNGLILKEGEGLKFVQTNHISRDEALRNLAYKDFIIDLLRLSEGPSRIANIKKRKSMCSVVIDVSDDDKDDSLNKKEAPSEEEEAKSDIEFDMDFDMDFKPEFCYSLEESLARQARICRR